MPRPLPRPFALLAATGMLGSGFREESIARGLELGARLIGCDSGTTDFGPGPLATGRSQFSREAIRRDTEVILTSACRAGIPVVIGSAGGAGGDLNLSWMHEIVWDIARENGLHFNLALIHAEQSRRSVKQLLAEGRVMPLPAATPLTDEAIDQSLHIVAMMGAEPIMAALDEAQVIVAGRASDAAIY
ncbi:MAG TPA: acyclic terpene utilization AtuA family protein, partial [Candidatus Dormibacteraeota bacterium]